MTKHRAAPAMTPPSIPARETCEIRALDTERELLESYRLRYEIYGALGYLQSPNTSGIEIDEYDLASISFGAFDRGSGALIGTLRLILSDGAPDHEPLVRGAVGELTERALIEQAFRAPPHPLPSIVSADIDRQIAAFNTDGYAVHELSRTIVHPDHRGTGVSRGLMEFGLAYASRPAHAVLVGGCLPEHLPMYARYGYLPLTQSGLDHFDSVGKLAHAVVCRTDVLPQPTRAHIDALHEAMASGATEHTLEIGHDSRAVVRLAPPRRARRTTHEWKST